MKFIKYLFIFVLAGVLAGCGSHGFEGEYKLDLGSSNQMVQGFFGMVVPNRIVIGPNYIDAEGQRTQFDDIFVRKSGSEKYLVFKKGESEDAWKILDDKTLFQGNDLVQLKYVRVK